ncbi:unnamed protein product, partial [marine sediment metagenome]
MEKTAAALAADPPPAEDEVRELVPPETTSTEYTPKEVKEIKAIATALIDPTAKGADKFALGACITMLASRQTYMAALVDLNSRLKELEVKHVDGVRQTLVEAMQTQAQQAFSRAGLVEKVQRHVLPWLMATSQSEDARLAA